MAAVYASQRFTISRGVDNVFTFTVKRNGSTLPIVITGGDTFVAHLIPLSSTTSTPEVSTALTVVDANNGKVALTYPAALTTTLASSKGGAEDGYYVRPTYKIVFEFNTNDNGYFTAKVNKVYVD